MTDQQDDLNKPPEPDHGVSARALHIAKMVDRLSPGRYVFRYKKPAIDAGVWILEVDRLDYIQNTSLPKKLDLD